MFRTNGLAMPTAQIDAVAELSRWIREISALYAKDLKAITQGQYAQSFGEKTQRAQDFTAEVCTTNARVAARLRGAELTPPTEEEIEA